MSPRDPFGIDPEDLGVRARRGLLNRAEKRDLERATEASATLRIAYEVGRDMDGATAVRGGDDALIARAAEAALARVAGAAHGAGHARGKRWTAAAAAALFVVSGSGLAAALWSGTITWPFASETTAPRVTEQAQPRAQRPVRAVKRESAVEGSAAEPAAPALPRAEEAGRSPSARARLGSAAELFHAANAARRSGDFARAARLYAELRTAYPDTDEGALARVSLGQLLLARGDAKAAEVEFRRYLARGPGQLAEEALVGQAQSWRRMGRARAERDSLERLLADHPKSVYAAQAQLRLAELEGAASSAP